MRCLALRDAELPVPDLRRLAAAAEPFIRQGVARHPHITDALLERLLSDPVPEGVDDAAANSAPRPDRTYRILIAAGL
ncbi:hypothetical protein SHKM778_38480 [Streptomyces sp. KM77-8]|uniref:Uncharacterized protein n=1 Tax=Streptomyces haneummycinicus TaxID=3074435 RepID=A0AAT9HJL1_9ACTN